MHVSFNMSCIKCWNFSKDWNFSSKKCIKKYKLSIHVSCISKNHWFLFKIQAPIVGWKCPFFHVEPIYVEFGCVTLSKLLVPSWICFFIFIFCFLNQNLKIKQTEPSEYRVYSRVSHPNWTKIGSEFTS